MNIGETMGDKVAEMGVAQQFGGWTKSGEPKNPGKSALPKQTVKRKSSTIL